MGCPHRSDAPRKRLLKIRKELGAFNLRPVTVPESLAENSPLRPEAVSGLDLFTVRELTGGIYFGEPVGEEGEGAENEPGTPWSLRGEIERESPLIGPANAAIR